MERVPPQLDLKRLCDAADEIVKFYRGRIQRNWGIVNDLDWELQELEHAIMIIPRRFWEGWTDAACERFANVSEKAKRVLSYWWEVRRHAEPNDRIVEQYGNVYAGVRKHIEFAQFEFENRIDELKESADLLREKLKSPWPFHLLPDPKSQSLFRDEQLYKDNAARLGNWFPVIAAICNADGFLDHAVVEREYQAAGGKGNYKTAFKKLVTTKLGVELEVLDVEITSQCGKGWRLQQFR
jgi:hypothetical protein